jgi:hypothetical protein
MRYPRNVLKYSLGIYDFTPHGKDWRTYSGMFSNSMSVLTISPSLASHLAVFITRWRKQRPPMSFLRFSSIRWVIHAWTDENWEEERELQNLTGWVTGMEMVYGGVHGPLATASLGIVQILALDIRGWAILL